ncbi:MAG: hypothetical protein IJV40_16790 [Oscillospiraceae bacterium]|nr:hypothetical protein [Oscillospiraceae bacterium]
MFEDTFMTARTVLGRVKELTNQLEVSKRRAQYKAELGEDTSEIESGQKNLEQSILEWKSSILETLTNLPTAMQATVMMKRYVDLMSWEDIAEDMDVGVREVQKLHGKALPILDEMLRAKDEVHSA